MKEQKQEMKEGACAPSDCGVTVLVLDDLLLFHKKEKKGRQSPILLKPLVF